MVCPVSRRYRGGVTNTYQNLRITIACLVIVTAFSAAFALT
ncbi:hypothetical protein AB0I60_32685 [Actinosynnema sp. NPDC050436]